MDLSKLGETWMDVVEFKHGYTNFKRDTKVRDFLNKAFDASLVAVYTDNRYQLSTGSLDWSGGWILTVSKSGKVVWMSNSEWADFQHVKQSK